MNGGVLLAIGEAPSHGRAGRRARSASRGQRSDPFTRVGDAVEVGARCRCHTEDLAVVLGEPDAERLLATLQANAVALSAVSLTEAAIVVEARQGPDASRDLELLVAGAVDRVVAVDDAHARVAIGAWRRFGRGRHPAALNFGDCFAYATASLADAPLLFKGEDFVQTDLRVA